MPRTMYYKLKSIERSAMVIQQLITTSYQNAPFRQSPVGIKFEITTEEAEYLLQAIRIGLGEMAK